MPEEGSCVHSHGVAKCNIWYNDKRLIKWSGGYNLSGSKLNLCIKTHTYMGFFYSSSNR